MNSHLSRPPVARRLKPPVGAHRANVSLRSALLRIGFAGPRCLQRAGELLPRLSTLTYGHRASTGSRQKPSHRRYISVALSLGSPPAAVSRYPALRSSDFPHTRFPAYAAAQLTQATSLPQNLSFVKRRLPYGHGAVPLRRTRHGRGPSARGGDGGCASYGRGWRPPAARQRSAPK